MAAKACRLAPEVTEGPFYEALDKIRRDITEGRPGVPLTLKIRVIDVKRCKPIHSAAVDIWHFDAGGLYSDESSNGTGGTLRGGHVSHTGQLFFAESASSSVYSLAPYSSDTAPRTLNSSDSIYSQAGGTRAEVGLTGSAASGFVGRFVVGVNPKKTPARV